MGKDSKVSIYSYGDDSYYDAEIKDVDDSKLENLQADFQSGMVEWIDIRRFKFNVLNPADRSLPTSAAESNLPDAPLQARASDRSNTPEAVESQDHATNSGETAASTSETGAEVNGTKAEIIASSGKTKTTEIPGPSTTNLAFVDRGTVIAIRWKRPYILYDATVVKMKDDGSQYLLQYHYDSCTKWVDLRKSEFYVIGLDDTFHSMGDEGAPARATRRARKSGPEAPAEEPTRKRRRTAGPLVATDVVEDLKPEAQDEAVVQTVNEREMSGFQTDALGQLAVGSRIAIWTRNKEYRKASVRSFDKSREEFEIQYDTDKNARKLHLRQYPFLILQPVGELKPETTLPPELENHENPDISLVEVGTRVGVLWDGDMQFYSGTIKDKREGHEEAFFLHYDDNDEEWIDLSKYKFKIEEEGPSR